MLSWLNPWKANRELRATLADLETKAARSMESIIADGGGTGPAAQTVDLSSARNQEEHFRGHAYTAIGAIAKRVAGLDLYVGRSGAGGLPLTTKAIGDELSPLLDHPLLNSINSPNPHMVRWSLLYSTIAELHLTGRAYWWLIPLGSDGSSHIWPLPASWVEPVGAPATGYKVRPPGRVEPFDVPMDEMTPFVLPDPANPFGCKSPLQTQASAINADEQLQAAQSVAFSNGGRPGMVLTVGKLETGVGPAMRPTLTPEQRKQLVDAIKLAYIGVAKRGEPIILDGMIESCTPYERSPQEMDFLESGKATRGRIFQAFGVNPLIVGEIEGANRAQAVVAEQSFISNVIRPLTVLLGQTLTKFFAPRFGSGLVVWFERPQARDDELKLRAWQYALTAGAVDEDEYRQHVLNIEPRSTAGLKGIKGYSA